jgi:predicted Zn finger-like uncharacterized protein
MPEENLEPLVTECPNCDTRFRVTETQLQVAKGRVRCGACLTVFDGTARLSLDGEPLGTRGDSADVDALLEELNDLSEVDEKDIQADQEYLRTREQLPDALLALEAELIDDLHNVGDAPAELQPTDLQEEPPIGEAAASEARAADSGAEDQVAEAEDSPSVPDIAGPEPPLAVNLAPDVGFADLEEVEDPPAKHSRATLALILLAIVALPGQVLWFQYESWIMDPDYRPIYVAACSVLGCELPHMRDVAKITSKKSIIRAHPERDDARVVDVLMINTADFPQPFPLIELMATSLRGQLIAGRRFKPAEYLQGDLAQAELFPPNTPVHVSLEIQDPGEQALNFEVRFR